MELNIYYLAVFVGAYFIGGFPTGVALSRHRYGLDVRGVGSGNIGASNITRTFGWFAGVLTLVIDALKGAVPLVFVLRYFPNDLWMATTCGIGVVVGHCFSPYLKFRGGKGVATSLGVVAVVMPYAALVGLGAYAILLAISRISAVGSLAGLGSVIVYVITTNADDAIKVLVYTISAIVFIRHYSNVRRIADDLKVYFKSKK